MVVVKKRGSARFFARDPRDTRKLVNPPPGTIIDHTVTNQGIPSILLLHECQHPHALEWYDFYLISQMARQGTVAPTHFNVIWDQTGFVLHPSTIAPSFIFLFLQSRLKVDHMQRLTQKLCHLYYKYVVSFDLCCVTMISFLLSPRLVGQVQSVYQVFVNMHTSWLILLLRVYILNPIQASPINSFIFNEDWKLYERLFSSFIFVCLFASMCVCVLGDRFFLLLLWSYGQRAEQEIQMQPIRLRFFLFCAMIWMKTNDIERSSQLNQSRRFSQAATLFWKKV